MKIKAYHYLSVFFAFLFLSTSCDDWFDIKPQSEIVFENFWKEEADVLSMVASCYRGMNEPDFMERLIVWGEVRSDNVLRGTGGTSDDLTRLFELTFNASNGYTKWNNFYTVINYCNLIIRYAPEAKEKDPNFTDAQLKAYIAEAKGIRALCHFILVKTFRDIPLVLEPTSDDTRAFEMAQSSPEEALRFLIDDLKSVLNDAVVTDSNIAVEKGRLTRQSMRALIADMALWINDYDQCIRYCDEILNNADPSLKLSEIFRYSIALYIEGNAAESLFELQFSQSGIRCYPMFEMYSSWNNNAATRDGRHYLLSSLKLYDGENLSSSLFQPDDARRKDAFCSKEDGGYYPIIKYVGGRLDYGVSDPGMSSYGINPNNANWIFYRLSDVYLMKAEALVELGGYDNLNAAFELVEKTYDRANMEAGPHTLQYGDYDSQEKMRDLVFDERQREFLFEGKRYFDLIRRIQREKSTTHIVNKYLTRKYVSLDLATVKSKLRDIDAMYMPINQDELKINPLLKQNPYYETTSVSNIK